MSDALTDKEGRGSSLIFANSAEAQFEMPKQSNNANEVNRQSDWFRPMVHDSLEAGFEKIHRVAILALAQK